MSDASSDASSVSADDGNCDSCGSWGLTSDSPGSGFNTCQNCHGNFCNHCSIMCPGDCSQEFCSDCARTSLVHYLPDDGRTLHVTEVEGDEFSHNAQEAAGAMFDGTLAPFCSSNCVHAFSVRYSREIYYAKIEVADTNARLAAHLKLKKLAMFFKFLIRLGFFNETKRMAATEAVYAPGGKGHKRSRDEFEELACPQLYAVRTWVNDLFGNLS